MLIVWAFTALKQPLASSDLSNSSFVHQHINQNPVNHEKLSFNPSPYPVISMSNLNKFFNL